MKHLKLITTIAFAVLIFGVMVVAGVLMQNASTKEEAMFTTQIRAAGVTYKRKFTILPASNGTGSVELSPTEEVPVEMLTPAVEEIASESGQVVPTEVPLVVEDPSASPIASEEATPTLPVSGWIHNSLVMIIAATTLIFLSFLY